METWVLVTLSILVIAILTSITLLIDWFRRRLDLSRVRLAPYLVVVWGLVVLLILLSIGDVGNPTHVLVAFALFALVAWTFYANAGKLDEFDATPPPRSIRIIGPIAFIRKYRSPQTAPSTAAADDRPFPTAPVTVRRLYPEEIGTLRTRAAQLRQRTYAVIVGLAVMAAGLVAAQVPFEAKAVVLTLFFWLTLLFVGGFTAERLGILQEVASGRVEVVATHVDAVVPQTGFLLVGGHIFHLRDRRLLDGVAPGVILQVEYIPGSRTVLRLNGSPVL